MSSPHPERITDAAIDEAARIIDARLAQSRHDLPSAARWHAPDLRRAIAHTEVVLAALRELQQRRSQERAGTAAAATRHKVCSECGCEWDDALRYCTCGCCIATWVPVPQPPSPEPPAPQAEPCPCGDEHGHGLCARGVMAIQRRSEHPSDVEAVRRKLERNLGEVQRRRQDRRQTPRQIAWATGYERAMQIALRSLAALPKESR